MAKLDLILDTMVTWEFPLFIALFVRQYSGNKELRRNCIVIGCAVYLVTCVIQIVLLIYLFVGSYDRQMLDNGSGQQAVYVVGAFVATVLTGFQLYTVYIFYLLHAKDARNETSKQAVGKADENEKMHDSPLSPRRAGRYLCSAEDLASAIDSPRNARQPRQQE